MDIIKEVILSEAKDLNTRINAFQILHSVQNDKLFENLKNMISMLLQTIHGVQMAYQLPYPHPVASFLRQLPKADSG